jgi:hypothetical protein
MDGVGIVGTVQGDDGNIVADIKHYMLVAHFGFSPF